MINAQSVPLGIDRGSPRLFTIEITGIDLTGADLHAQIRLSRDAPGDPIVDLPRVTDGTVAGVRLVAVDNSGTLPISWIRLQIPAMNDGTGAGQLPLAPELGDDVILYWDMIVTPNGFTADQWFYGPVRVRASVTRTATLAPLVNDPLPGADAVATLIGADLSVTLAGASLIQPLLDRADGSAAAAVDAAAHAETKAQQATDAAAVAQQQVGLAVKKAGDSMTGPLDLGGNRIPNVGTPANRPDAANKGYADDQVAPANTSLSSWTTLAATVVEPGTYYNRTSGKPASLSSYTSYSYACASGGAYRVTATIGGAATAMVVFYDANGVLLGIVNPADAPYINYKRQLFFAPIGAAKMIVSCTNSGGASCLMEQTLFRAQRGQHVDDTIAAVSDLKTFNPATVAWQAGAFTNRTTGAQTAVGSFTTGSVGVAGGERMRVTATLGGDPSIAALVTFLDPRGQVLSSLYPGAGTGTQAYLNQEFDVPADARTVWVNATTDTFGMTRVETLGTAPRASQSVRDRIAAVEAVMGSATAAISAWGTLVPTATEAGYYYARSNGAKAAASTYTSYRYACSAGTTYRLSASIGGAATAMVVFFDATGAFHSWINAGGADFTHYKRALFVAPIGAVSMVVSCSNTGGAACLVEGPTLIPQAGQTVGDNAGQLANLRTFVAVAPVWTVGSYTRKADGVQVAVSSFATGKVSVAGGERMRFSAPLIGDPSLVYAITILDPRGIVISTQFAGPGTTAQTYINQEFDVPDAGRTVWINSTATGYTAAKVETLGVPARVLQDTRDRLAVVEAASTSNSANVNKLKSYYAPSTATVVSSSFYFINTGAITPIGSASFKRLTLVGVQPGDTVKISATINGSSLAVATFYAADGTSFLGYLGPAGTTTPVVYTDFPVTIPAGAYFIGVSSYGTDPSVKVFGVPDVTPDARLSLLETPVAHLKATGDFWSGKKIVWLGTSIPAGSGSNAYPFMISQMLGANVVNQSLPSSIARAGIFANKSASDPLGWTGMNWDNLWRALSHTPADKDELINNWESKWRDLLTGTSKPSTLDAATQATWRAASYQAKLAGNLDADLFVIDHGNNDAVVAPGGYEGTELVSGAAAVISSRDRTMFYGALNTVIDYILAANPRARILILGHYENGRKAQISQAQAALAAMWEWPIIKLWEHTGWSQQLVATTGYWTNGVWTASGGAQQNLTLTQIWLADNLHPHSDTSMKANALLAGLIAARLRDVR